jgi:hypothetical protein
MIRYLLNLFTFDYRKEVEYEYLSRSTDLCDLERRQKNIIYGMKDWRTL